MPTFSGTPSLAVTAIGPEKFRLTVTYFANFTAAEVAFPEGFAESCAFFEDDSDEPFGGDDDHYWNHPIRTFRPAEGRNRRVFSVEPFTADELDTEVDGEEIYAVVHLRRNIDGLISQTKRSNTLPLSV
jgi:hypothetical protein